MTTRSRTVDSRELLRDQLDPVGIALLHDAELRASRVLSEARTEADSVIAAATTAADDEVRRAEERARAAARARSDQLLDRARADAHQHILRTRAAIAERVVESARRAALDLRDDPRYPELLDHLERLAHRQLGAEAEIERDPEGLGGIIAHHGDRRVDYTLSALADRALGEIGDDIEALWS